MSIHFGPFTLNMDTRQLTGDGRAIHLTPKAFDLLVILASERPKVVSKTALQQRLWPDTFVVEANVANLVGEIRGALGDRGRSPRWIRTSHRLGYAFCGEVMAHPRADAADEPLCWFEWGRRRFPLSIGEHVIGRDPDVEVTLDASTVSRRHAKVVVSAEGVVLEDFGSKNGTVHGQERVTSPVRLADGDTIRVGSVLVTFHVRRRPGPVGSTETQNR